MSKWQHWMGDRTPFRALKSLKGDSQNLDENEPLGDREACKSDNASLVSSRVSHYSDMFASDVQPAGNYHMPVLDIDYPAHLIESSTPGHYHLYLNQWVQWDDYVKLLKCMQRCGLLQSGFVKNSVKRGASFTRLPGVKKGEEHVV